MLRSRRAVAENLRIRAAELSAERDRYTAEAVRLERTKIARELHDVVAHCMTVIVIQSRAGRHLLGSDPAAAKEALDVIVAVAAEAEADIGALVKLMDPELTRPLTRSLLDELVTRAGATGATITAEITGDPDDLDPATAVVAHRVIQEAITNAFRHAPGAAIRIVLAQVGLTARPARRVGLRPARSSRATRGWGRLHPRGDQRAAPADDPADDVGYRSGQCRRAPGGIVGRLGERPRPCRIRERVARVGGNVSWGVTPSGGWRVLARFAAAGSQ